LLLTQSLHFLQEGGALFRPGGPDCDGFYPHDRLSIRNEELRNLHAINNMPFNINMLYHIYSMHRQTCLHHNVNCVRYCVKAKIIHHMM
jgi:hypothetical protein